MLRACVFSSAVRPTSCCSRQNSVSLPSKGSSLDARRERCCSMTADVHVHGSANPDASFQPGPEQRANEARLGHAHRHLRLLSKDPFFLHAAFAHRDGRREPSLAPPRTVQTIRCTHKCQRVRGRIASQKHPLDARPIARPTPPSTITGLFSPRFVRVFRWCVWIFFFYFTAAD